MLSLELVPSAINSTSLPTLPITSSILSIKGSNWIIKSRRRTSISLRAFLNKPSSSSPSPKHHHSINQSSLSVFQTSLRFLDWDKLSDSIASFATTSFGQQAVKAQLWNLNRNYTESMQLLQETKAAVEMHNHGSCILDFTSIPMGLVKSALQKGRRSLPVDGTEAIALVALLRLAEYLQLNLKAAVKEDVDWFQRFMPVAEMIMELVISQKLVKVIPQLVDEDGSVKDSASSILKQSRDQVRLLEKKLYKLMEGLVMNMNETSSLEVSNVGGRWCIKSGADMQSSLEGLLLSSGSSSGSLVEPLSAVPLNDELQQARESVAKAEADVLLNITHKIQVDLDDIEFLFNKMILLDVINARARYSLSYGGTYPNLYLPEEDEALKSRGDRSLNASHPTERKWKVYLPKAYHPLLLQQHRVALHKAIENVNNVTSEIRRRKQRGQNVAQIEETSSSLSFLQMQVDSLKEAPPIPVDIFVAEKTQVVVITGPNTGGKTICLKTLGLAAMMAKSGVYVLASEPVKIPWFDSVFADIGDEQSLSQSLSTFSGHLKQTGDILSHSTSRSLVLLDEVGAGTNPLEGAALGMSLLESFAEACTTLLTLATTHHGELKTLKYSNNAFENACMEFDEVKLKPTYKILWGIPGRSNAISIAERLGVPDTILRNSRELYGAASAEINEVILEMERFKQNIDEHTYQAQHYLKVSRDIHENLVRAKRKVAEHGRKERYRKMKEISELASSSRSILHNKLRQLRASMPPQTSSSSPRYTFPTTTLSSTTVLDNTKIPVQTNSSHTIINPRSGGRAKVPKIGDTVHVSSLNKKATVIKVELSKQEILVQAGNMRLKLKLADVT